MTRSRVSLLILLCLAGCLWRSYANILSVHVDVLTQTAAKLVAVVQANRMPAAEDMAEYTYPSKRAREFLHQFRGDSQRRSYQQLGELLDRYDAMVHEVDAARAQGQVPGAARLTAQREALQALAEAIRAQLQRE